MGQVQEEGVDNPLTIVRKDGSNDYSLVPTSGKTVQPVALLRLSVFSPIAPKERGKRDFELDASDELSEMEIAKREGYTKISIKGMKLNMSTDFKVWVGIIMAFSKYGFSSNTVEVEFTQFARMCGFNPNDINKRMRKRLHESLMNISTVVVGFSDKEAKKTNVTHLVQKSKLDAERDVVVLEGDPDMWELYRFDHKILLHLKTLDAIPRKEAAQALYIYFESMPNNGPVVTSMKRLRERLTMMSPVKRQNQIIRAALEDLRDIGYLEYSEAKRGRDIQIMVYSRNPKLKPVG